jgi:chorismate dehydratase
VQQFLRVGCVKYLNARPLIHGWRGQVLFDHPSLLCRTLAGGDLDVALVSSFEFLRNPIYRIVEGVSISSDGPVYSVVVAHKGQFEDLNEIELDPAAKTSVNLLRCLLSESRHRPKLIEKSTSLPAGNRGRLMIGDQAIQFRREHSDEFNFWDLGQEWKKRLIVPFVYALWLVRPEVENAKAIAEQLRATRDENLRQIEKLIAEQDDPVFCDHYYRQNLRFSFGTEEQNGLRTFQSLCRKHGLIQKTAPDFALV